MPKRIEDLPRRLMEEARRQVQESGYSALTIRSVAKGCGVGVGTVYNYYASRDALVASFLLSDWNCCLEEIRAEAEAAAHPEPVLRKVYGSLEQFLQQHAAVFRDETAAAGFSGASGHYHSLLRSQLPSKGSQWPNRSRSLWKCQRKSNGGWWANCTTAILL